jgi:hypothetical protein
MWRRDRKSRIGRFSNGQETSQDNPQNERAGRFSEGQQTSDGPMHEEHAGRFSMGQEMLSETSQHPRVGRFSEGQETIQGEDGVGEGRARVDHGLPGMSFRTAFSRREQVTPRASEQGLIEAANRLVFHDRGYTLTWDTETGDLWLTPTTNPEGWWYEEDVG